MPLSAPATLVLDRGFFAALFKRLPLPSSLGAGNFLHSNQTRRSCHRQTQSPTLFKTREGALQNLSSNSSRLVDAGANSQHNSSAEAGAGIRLQASAPAITNAFKNVVDTLVSG